MTSAKQTPGTLPLRVEIIRPDNYIIKDWIVTQSGYGKVTIPTAPNEPRGEWRIKVTEPASGITSEKTIQVN